VPFLTFEKVYDYYLNMKKMLIILLLPFIFASSVYAQNWSKKDNTLFTLFATGIFIDCMQTNYIFTHNRFKERNSVIRSGVKSMRRTFIPLYFTTLIFSTRYILNKFPNNYREYILSSLIIVEGITITRNMSIGVGLNFKF